MNHYEPLFFFLCTEFSDKPISAFLFGEKGQRDIQMIILPWSKHGIWMYMGHGYPTIIH
jgi:hypothetical protein